MGVDVNYPTEFGTLHVQEYTHQLNLVISVTYTDYPPEGPEDSCLVTITDADFTVDICEMMGGRWEHTVVGKDASSVDSIGAALVTAAFKNKQIEIGIGSLDMEEEEVNDVPWVMRKFGDGMAKLDYHHYAKPDYDVDVDPLYPTSTVHRNRTSVKDDWCHTWQISGANLISIGGPGANLLSYYLNDFTDAIYGLPMFTPSYWSGAVAATTCWNKNYYFSGPEKGYAVIGTYHDINGTTALTIWGVWGRDTYYASRFFHEELIYEFQKFDPCITSVILEIDYTDKDHPTFDIVEVLGTISEHTDWTEMWDARKFLHTPNSADYDYQYPSGLSSAWTITKGGIHDP
jgi:hypothetical protein